tara:strand:- start:268 stop:486 length:219 start_codon:yes stop_codon:yes gene_type:complete
MRGLLCVAFSLGWPVAIWFIANSVVSFVFWNNYFVIELGAWHLLARFAFIMFWLIGIIIFIGFLTDNKSEDY